MAINLNPNDRGVFGLPPGGYISDHMIYNTMPVLEIQAGEPHLVDGLTVFSIHDARPQYEKLLLSQGYTAPYPLKYAFIADSFPSDSFSNEYGETFLHKFTDVASQGFGQLTQMTGQRNALGALHSLGTSIAGAGKEAGGATGELLQLVGGGAAAAAGQAEKIKNAFRGTALHGAVDIVDKMLAGARVDFPQVWRNSGFTPSYSVTIRLYNPKPSSELATKKYIIGPLATLLCLAVPRTDDGKTYNWPFFQKMVVAGIWRLNPAVITNITVIKGGDQQSIGWNQRMGIVDVRLDIGSLFTSMVVEEGGLNVTNRPTVRNYLESLQLEKATTQNSVYGEAERKSGMIPVTTSLSTRNTPGFDVTDESRFLRKGPFSPPSSPTNVVEGIVDRVSTTASNIASDLVKEAKKTAGALFPF
jgi:hypothetical protein